MNVKTMSTFELKQAKEEMEKQFKGIRECLNSLDIREMISPKEKEAEPEISKEKLQEIIGREISKAIRKAQGALE